MAPDFQSTGKVGRPTPPTPGGMFGGGEVGGVGFWKSGIVGIKFKGHGTLKGPLLGDS